MDLLKEELQKKRRSVDQGFADKKFVKRSDLHNKHLQQLRDEERRKLQAKSLRTTAAAAIPSTTAAATATAAAPSEERRIDDPRPEVIRRLCLLKQPITLFGEDDNARLDQLKLTLKSGVFEVDSDMTEGQTNDFLRDIYELRKRQKTGILYGGGKDKDKDGMDDDESGDGYLSGDGGSSGVDADKDLKRMKADFEGLCEEDQILVFFRRLLNEWNQELEEMPEKYGKM